MWYVQLNVSEIFEVATIAQKQKGSTMRARSRRYKALFFALLFSSVLAHPVFSGTNAGFEAKIQPREVSNPQVGQVITIPIHIEEAKEANISSKRDE